MSVSKVSPLQLLTAPVRLALFDPRVTAPLLIAILYYPEKLRSLLTIRLHPLISSPVFIKTLKVALGLGVLRGINNKLSQWVVNNWKSDAKFVKSQEIVLISGGTSGIGKLVAEYFAKQGVKTVVLDINAPKEPFPSGIYFYRVDVTSSSDIASVAAEIRKDVGEPTVLINNAGVGSGTTILEGTEESVRRTFDVNTISHFIMVKEFLPAMVKKNHGHVVTIASMASFLTLAQTVDYACSKASALTFHEGLHSELRSRYNAPDVRTTVVHPGWVRTPLIEPLLAKPGFNDPVLEPEYVAGEVVKQVMSGRGGQLVLPPSLIEYTISTIRAWPSWLQTSARNQVAHTLETSTEEYYKSLPARSKS